MEEMELVRGSQNEGRTPEVDKTVKKTNVQRPFAKPKRGRGVESRILRNLSGGHDHGTLNSQGRRAAKHITGGGVDADVRVLSFD